MIHANNLIHFYGKERAIDGISLRVAPGEFVALTGESGSGKSTLLAILSTLLRPDSGELRIDGKPAKEWGDLNRFRREYIGFVFQFHYLIPYLSVAENVALAAGRERREAIPELLDRLGVAEIAPKKADEISGGQRQRAAIARAVANAPKILFADEPTGNLDSKNSRKVFDLFRRIAAEGTTLVVATHDRTLAREADRVLEIKDGRLV